MKYIPLQIALASILFPSLLLAQTRPSEDVTVGSPRQLTLPGFNYLYVDVQTTRKTIAEAAAREVPNLFAALQAANIQLRGPMVFITEDRPADPDAVFDLKMGIAVGKNAVAPSGYEVDPLPPVECLTVLYGGPLSMIGQAFHKLLPSLDGPASVSAPTGEIREYFFYFESATSPNNVTLIASVLK
jgi:hypothetical protein